MLWKDEKDVHTRRFKLIACEVFTRELCAAIAQCPNEIDVEFLPKGLHDLGCEGMSARLNAVLERVEEELYEAVLFGYGLCNNGLVGLEARSIPLVVPRAHDCIAVFLGGRKRYDRCFQQNPGTYFLTSGWIERGETAGQLGMDAISNRMGFNKSYEELVEEYGEDEGAYLWEQLGGGMSHYTRLAFIEMGVEPSDRFERIARNRAESKGWDFEKMRGDPRLIRQLVNGEWNEKDFLVVPPGHRLAPSHDESVIQAKPVDG